MKFQEFISIVPVTQWCISQLNPIVAAIEKKIPKSKAYIDIHSGSNVVIANCMFTLELSEHAMLWLWAYNKKLDLAPCLMFFYCYEIGKAKLLTERDEPKVCQGEINKARIELCK